MEICEISGCPNKRYSGALCSKHYNRMRTTGTTNDGPRARANLAERFWRKVEKRGPDECWPWVGGSWNFGYGVIGMGGRSGIKLRTNRLAYELENGEIPKNQIVRHTCHNRACCNPKHLVVGSISDNVQDMWRREVGAPKGNARITENDVIYIRSSNDSRAILAEMFGVCIGHIKAIQSRRCWKHVT